MHPIKGVEFDAPTSRAMTHYVGIAVLILALAVLLHVIRWW